MFSLVKIAETLILPPGLFLVLGCAAAVLALFRLRKTAVLVTVVVFASIYLLSIEPVSDRLMSPLENEYPAFHAAEWKTADKAPAADAVVVLGGGSVTGAPNAPIIKKPGSDASAIPAALSADSTTRVVYAYQIAKATHLPIIAAGGAPLKARGTESEGKAMQDLLLALGMNPALVHVESESRTTWENAADIMKLYHPRKVVLVTSAYHMARAVYCFRKQGIAVIPAPTGYRVDRPATASLIRYFPDISSLRDSSNAIRERIALIFYHIRYGGLPRPKT